LTLARNGWPISIRTFDAAVAGSPDEVGREIASTGVFWRDRLSGERLSGAFVHASDEWFETLGVQLTREFGCEAQRAEPPQGLVVAGLPTAIHRAAVPALAILGQG
jgi:hypothetical protein